MAREGHVPKGVAVTASAGWTHACERGPLLDSEVDWEIGSQVNQG